MLDFLLYFNNLFIDFFEFFSVDSLPEPSSLFLHLSQEFLFPPTAPNTMQMPVSPKLTSPATLSRLGSDSQSQLPSEHLHWDALLICLSSFSPDCSSFKCPYLSRWSNHPLVIQSRLSGSSLSLCSPSTFTAINTKACQVSSELCLQSVYLCPFQPQSLLPGAL